MQFRIRRAFTAFSRQPFGTATSRGSVIKEGQSAVFWSWVSATASATIGSMEPLTDEARQDARLDACRKARLRVLMRGDRLHMPPGSGSVAASLGITLQVLAHDVERALLREDARLLRERSSGLPG
jgi:hypothetical protein